jgi:hypothetical protein
MIAQNKAMTVVGWILTGIVSALLAGPSAGFKLAKAKDAVEGMQKFGYPEALLVPIGVTEVVCTVLYLVPRTAVLGAVLLTGYLGGATATHVRVEDAFVIPIVIGVVVWLALWLRDPRIRSLLPIRVIDRQQPS